MFYTFNQKNSGGDYVISVGKGIAVYVIIEAETIEEAIDKAEGIGLYFDGAGDCPCCGNRWNTYAEDSEVPMIYGEPAEDYFTSEASWRRDNNVCIHYADGTKKWFNNDGNSFKA